MQTRPYSDLYALVSALCGVAFASTEEPRIRALINRRAVRAYKSTNYWTRFIAIGENRSVFGGVVPFFQAGLSQIDTFLRVYSGGPHRGGCAQEMQFAVGPSGAILLGGGIDYSAVFLVYKGVISFNNTGGPSSSSIGVTSLIPEEWFEYIAHGTYADYLRAEGQQEKATIADAEASEILLDELMKLDEQHTQTIIAKRVFTNMNMQDRGGSAPCSNAGGDQATLPDTVQGDNWDGFTWAISGVEPGNTDFSGTLTQARFSLRDPYGASVLLLTSANVGEVTLNNASPNLWSVTVESRVINLPPNIYAYGLETTDSNTGVKTRLSGTLTVLIDPVS